MDQQRLRPFEVDADLNLDRPLMRALSVLAEGFLVFDSGQRLVFSNPACAALLALPAQLLVPGTQAGQIARFQAERGETPEDFAPMQDLGGSRITPAGKTLQWHTRMIPGGGWLRSYADVSDCAQALSDTSAREVVLRFALEGAGDGVWDWDVLSDKTRYSQRWKEMMGFTGPDLAVDFSALAPKIHPDDFDRAWAAVNAHLAGSSPGYISEHRRQHKDGSWRWLLARGMVASRDAQGKPLRMTGTTTDITERKLAEEKLLLAATVFEHAREGIIITDAAGRIVEVNATFSQITGYGRDEVLGHAARMLRSTRHRPEFYTLMWLDLQASGNWAGEVGGETRAGQVFAAMLTVSTVKDAQGKMQNLVALFTDITQSKAQQRQLKRIAHFDALTGLPNRVQLAEQLLTAMAHCGQRNQSLAVAYLDLDGFKSVNDRHGHAVGDALLIAVAQRMKSVLRDGDTLARIGGDEFVAVLSRLAHPCDSEQALARLLVAAGEPVSVGELSLRVSASIGVASFPQDGTDPDRLLRHADQAMYLAKQAGKNRFHRFDVAHDTALKLQRESLAQVREALNRHEFELHYQPKVNLRSAAVVGAEALIRWRHPQRGLLLPADFLPLIADHLLSVELGEWVITEALRQIAAWREQGLEMPVSVNIGALQLQQVNFVSRLATLLNSQVGDLPCSLQLEVLETSALEDLAQMSKLMHACHSLGVSFALDDFGTGYSSLTYLRHLPIKLLKIDQTFVRDMLTDPDDLAIVTGVIGLAKAFGREVIAEGVESAAHGAQLRELGCELAQGHGIAHPMPPAVLPDWVRAWGLRQDWQG